MKPKFIAFPRHLVLTSSAVMAVFAPLSSSAADFTWGGGTDSDWTNNANWTTLTAPTYGTVYSADTLRISNGAGATAVYNPGSALTTTFNTNRAFILGSVTAGSLTITSGTIASARTTNPGSEPIMANGANASLLINGGALDLSLHLNTFLFLNGGSGNTSDLTISSGSFSSNGFNFQTTGTGAGIINLDGGSMAVTAFVRQTTAAPITPTTTGSTTFNLDSGTLRARGSSTSFLPALTGLQTIVEDGGAVIDTNGFNITIAEILEHDATLGPTLDGGLTKNGVGTLTLSGASTFTGPVTINAGTALATPSKILLGNNTGAGTGTITMADSFTEIQTGNGRAHTNSIVISNTGDTKEILLPAGGSFVGATFSGPITIDETNIDNFRVRADDNCFLTFSGVVSGSGGIYKYQPGRLNLTNSSNSFTGDIKITHGEVSFTSGGLGSTATSRIRMEGSASVGGVSLRWDPTNNQDVSSRIDMFDGKSATFNLAEQATPTPAIASVTFASAIGNNTTASMVKTGPGTLTLTQPSTYSGGTTLSQGNLEFPNNGLGTVGTVTMNNGLLRWATGNTQDLSSRIAMVNGRTASFSTNGNDVTFANSIGSSTTANLTKTNTPGTLTLTQASTYSGSTTVGGGTLKIGNATSLGAFGPQTTTTPGTTILSGGTLDLNGTTGVNELITISGNGVDSNGAVVNNSGTPAGIGSGIVGLTVAATGSGTGFSTAPVVAITGSGTGATATASLGVTTASFTVNVAGDRNYSVAPIVTIAGGGTGATATAILSGGTSGTVTGITVTSAGSGFTTAPTAVISGGTTASGTITATFTGNATNFTVGGLALTSAGSGYTGTPTFTFDGSPATVNTTYSSVILAANSSVGGTGNTTIDGVVSESGGARALTKVGAGTVTLNGANTYTGETIVDAGTLAISTDDTLANAAAVRIDSAAILNLGFVGTDTVDRIFIGGVEQASGTWGSLASSATNKTARITGTGILDVTNGAAPANDYTAWAASQVPPVTGGPTGDSDNDGVKNLVEYALIGGGERGVYSGNTITFTKRGAPYGGDVTYGIETSTDLVGWSTPGGGVTESGSAISFLFTPSTPVKNFARLKVVQVP